MITISKDNIKTVPVPLSNYAVTWNNINYLIHHVVIKCPNCESLQLPSKMCAVDLSNIFDVITSFTVTSEEKCGAYMRIGAFIIDKFVILKGTKTYHFEIVPSLLTMEDLNIIFTSINVSKIMVSGIQKDRDLYKLSCDGKVTIKPNFFGVPINYVDGSFLFDDVNIHELKCCTVNVCMKKIYEYKSHGFNILFNNMKWFMAMNKVSPGNVIFPKELMMYVLDLLLNLCDNC